MKKQFSPISMLSNAYDFVICLISLPRLVWRVVAEKVTTLVRDDRPEEKIRRYLLAHECKKCAQVCVATFAKADTEHLHYGCPLCGKITKLLDRKHPNSRLSFSDSLEKVK